MGAMTALVVASSSTLPQAAILEDPPLFNVSSTPVSAEQSRRTWQWIFDVQALSDKKRQEDCHRDNPNWTTEEIEPWSASKDEFHTDIIPYLGTIHVSWRALVPAIQCPILLITGDPQRGAIVTPKNAQEMAHLWKQGTVASIAGAGHSIHRDRYDATMTAVHTFLNTIH